MRDLLTTNVISQIHPNHLTPSPFNNYKENVMNPIRCKVISSVRKIEFEHQVEDFFNEKGELDIIYKKFIVNESSGITRWSLFIMYRFPIQTVRSKQPVEKFNITGATWKRAILFLKTVNSIPDILPAPIK
jgi:hypothetical protein